MLGKMTEQQRARQLGPVKTALISMHLGYLHWDHCHDLIAQYFIAKSVATLVPKHRHLLPFIDQALLDLYNLVSRSNKGRVKANPKEVERIDLVAEIFEAMLKTTSIKTIKKAIYNLSKEVESAKANNLK